ncbi:MAG: M28 family peptidase [Janthinobacterium lividum]
MLKTLRLTAALVLAAGTVAAQTPTEPTGKVKVKTKRTRRDEAAPMAPATATPATAAAGPDTDYSLPYAATITPEALKQDLSVLASDEYEGRETGKKGQRMAADYIAKAFAADGLAGPVPNSDNPYLQHFTMNRVSLDPASAIQVGGKTYTQGKDFYVLLPGSFTGGPATVKPTFAGYGIKEDKYSDMATAPAAGSDLVILLGQPLNKAGQPLLGAASPYGGSGLRAISARTAALLAARPHSVFLVAPTAATFAQTSKEMAPYTREQLEFTDQPTPDRPGIVLVSPALGTALLGTTPSGLTKYEKGVATAGKPIASGFKPAAVSVQLKQKKEPFTTENVLGYLEGGDKKDEVVVLSAHYDHLGIKNGVVYNGADDDGSGTVSVLAMARAFTKAKQEGHGPRRSILFLANVGEEEGLLGSQYYTDHPIFPLANTVTDLNIDMVGRVDSLHQGKGDYVYLVGADRLSKELNTLSEATNQQYNPVALDYKYNAPDDPEHIYERSDHYNFAKHNVPIIFYTSGLHKDYHQSTDDVDKIDFPAMTRRDQLVFHTAWAVANRDQRIQVDEQFRASGYVPTAADLDRYAGTYSTAQMPLKIVLSKNDQGQLQAQATGQPAFPLEAVAPGVFKFDPAQVRLEFAADKPGFTLKQGGKSLEFTKQ